MLLRSNMKIEIVGFILLFAITNEVSCECGIAPPPVDYRYGPEPEIFPWHVLIYQKSRSSYSLKCAGTLTQPDTVVSAAHCFYNETGKRIFDASSFKVAAGKYFAPYNWPGRNIQESEIKKINLIVGYKGSAGSFSKDIARLILEKPFNITPLVNPVCTDSNNIPEMRSLQSGQIGKAVGCQRYRNGSVNSKLKDINFSFIPRDECKSMLPESRRPYITDDKFCGACLNDGIELSAKDSGSGLHFQHNGKWYLRGVLSFINASETTTNPLVFSDIRNFNYELSTSTDITRCGTIPEHMVPPPSHVGEYIIGGSNAGLGQYPWHVAIYSIISPGKYDLICSGSLISPSVVISAAHCFWDDVIKAKNNASNYEIAAGKINRMHNWLERFVQITKIRDIYIPQRYYGTDGNYAEDIAWLILERPMNITDFVRPVCLDMNNEHEMEDLRVGRIGRVAGWGFTLNREPSLVLMQLDLPYIGFDQCSSTFPRGFRPFITFDKFCAGYTNGSSLCNGDSGGGLVFQREGQWYLRGVVSNSPTNNNGTCDNNYYTVFTNVGKFTEDLYRFANFNSNDIIQ